MIKVSYTEHRHDGFMTYKLVIIGHAGYAEKGKDIVCSAVSILYFTGLRLLEKVAEKNDDIRAGYTKDPVALIAGCKDDDLENMKKIKGIFDMIITGITEVSDNYPEYVSLTK